MKHPTTLRHAGSLAAALAATLVLSLSAVAQEAAESAAPEGDSDQSGIVFPVMLGGQLLTPQTYDGEAWLARFAEGDDADPAFVADMQALLEGAGVTTDDLTVKTASYQPVPGEPPAVIAALRLDDTDARSWVESAVDVMVGDIIEPGLVMRPLDTKWALRVTDATMPGVYPRTIYLKDDTAWIIQGDNDYIWDALGQLPDADPVVASAADSLYTDMPLTLGGERRIGLYESTEPLFLPSLSERLGDGIEDWLLELYLEAGISPAEMLGVITWWGLDAAQDGIQIEGYRLPEGGAELTQRLLEDVFLARPPEVSVDPEAPVDDPLAELDDPFAELDGPLSGVSFSEEEIAGQAVTALDHGGALQYIYSSADTIWVISDPLGERAKVEEAIEALP